MQNLYESNSIKQEEFLKLTVKAKGLRKEVNGIKKVTNDPQQDKKDDLKPKDP